MNKSFYILTILALLIQPSLFLPPAASAQEARQGLQAPSDAILYVEPGGTGDCSSWAKACELQSALTSASAGSEIWAAAGTYKPGTNREDTFQMVSIAALYGGFAGTETSREQRDWEVNLTILSGDIGIAGNNSDNSYHVVTGSGLDATTILDGFTVTGGNADGVSPAHQGGGMYNYNSSPTLSNVIFSSNTADNGGGMSNDVAGSPTLSNVTFSGNTAGIAGGGMFNYSSSPTLSNVTFTGNTADGSGGGMFNEAGSSPALTNVTFNGNAAVISGGGMCNYNSSPTLSNVTFNSNTADYYGGGMYNNESSPTLSNVTFTGNTADGSGAGMYNLSSNPTLTNAIVWGNTPDQIYNTSGAPVVTYSDVQGGYAGTGNIDADPLFVNPAGGNLRLQPSSPAIDAGNNAAVPSGVTTDLDGSPRFVDIASVPDTGSGTPPIVDMGAYEAQFLVVYLPLTMK